jgi:hypothetical protein
MNANKGQAAVAGIVVLLVAGILGMMILADFTNGFCNCLPTTTGENASVPVSVWVNNTCAGEKCETDWYLVCDGDLLEVGTHYDIDGCNYMVTDIAYDGTPCTLTYTYEGDYYAGDSILGTIICLLPVLIALGLLTLAVGWAVLK